LGHHFTAPRFITFFEDLYHRFAHPDHWRLFPDARPVLRGLKKQGLRVGIVSNWDSRLLILADKIGLTQEVEFLVVSAVEGFVKPDRRLFDIALKRVQVAPAEALHVGDSLREDYRGARAAGLHALLLERGGGGPRGVQSIPNLAAVIPHVERWGGARKNTRSK
jgi:putative hydrolase of the HAD superfamily